ncbi:FAD-binding oxidoreductase [Pseudoxanthomonas wuyuanensis]|uniref:D-lactate dehydrogenase n=1 Tax=Pseudoxanthomonas wuyuanensis TaxID=1073196 RepID=A0A286DCA9_9GAMM|nr:FAD-linked oxidase C-terminal domain-containing protein [Pseudoxanthomonas wuyuanensis]KAF1719337.1 FAD-binding oxidoreductase [Pseudoxanthomonas wuyuanensis]SOD56295.1 D-lactate dehydrogenase [Pseudoxanthomonas wuyuanensis]
MNTPSSALDAELSALLGEYWRTDDVSRRAYGEDNSKRYALPAGVALPGTRQQVIALVRACRAHRVPLVARGAGTSSTGAVIPYQGGVVVSFERMNRILEVNPHDRYAIVEPGVLNGDLQRALAPHRLFWPPDPASADISTVGGNLACNAGGPHAVKYGATRDNVLGLSAVTGSGEPITCGSLTSKDATGYDLTHLLIGSEGTLALIVQATLKLLPLPAQHGSLRALYTDVSSAAAAVARIMAQPQTPSMLEFMDRACIRLAREVGGADIPDAGALLMIETDGDAATLPYALETIAGAANGEGLIALDDAPDDASREKLWAARRSLSPALRTIASGKINEDVVVPVSRIPELVAGVEAMAAEYALPIVAFGHAGNGNLHVNILFDPDDEAQSLRAQTALPRLFALTLSLGGTLSGEHGIGVAKREFMRDAFEPATLATMRAVKAALDPDGILNPGKVLP